MSEMVVSLGPPGASPAALEAPADLASTSGVVFDVQRHSLHDGPGVRTSVFLKGCPLRCQWCANPESQVRNPEPMLRAAHCIDCGLVSDSSGATPSCPLCWPAWQQDRASQATHAAIAARVDVCPTGALTWVGVRRTAGDVVAEVLRDRVFYGAGGGLTLTGGEPTMQPDYCEALLRLAKDAGMATAMETCGHTSWAVFERLAPWLDVFLFDVKHVDPDRHRRFTGLDNALILDNLRRLSAAGASVRVRVPLIPGFNTSGGDIAALASFVRSLPGPVQGVDLLPYHSMGRAKYEALGREYPWRDHKRLADATVQQLASLVADHGLPLTIGG